MKKIDKKIIQMKKYDLLSCPKCGSAFTVEGKSLKCPSGHTYDISKKGTVNFVLGYGEENYNMSMLEARERVIEQGFFNEIVRSVCEEIYAYFLASGREEEPIRILDAGCGDGSHIDMIGRYFTEKGIDTELIGVDISKDGISIAGRKDNEVLYFVADLSHLPFKENSFDVIVNILSPVNYKDFRRVLKEDGLCYKVIPDSGYLKELRKLYGLPEYKNQEIVSHLRENARVLKERKIRAIENVEAYADDLLLMTPMLWDREILDPGAKLTDITIEAELFTFGF
ncbi:methyltransferase domain-containing protein [Proteiniclasticum sp. C24MP]|uniref:methyltransferase domain-containing protein n=1 Tax=Proteiniclasticum sp. C24MP TaxID=3374101 RepID=UPI003754447B